MAVTGQQLRALTRPRMLLLHLLGVAAVTAATLLGLWQLDAWQTHRETRAADLADAEPVPLSRVMGADDPFPAAGLGRPVELSGRWLAADTVYVERDHDHEPGYWVVTPVSVCEPGTGAEPCPAMLVVRGWSATHPAPVPEPTGEAQVTGWLQPGEDAAPEAGSDSGPGAGGSEPDVRPTLRVADVLQRMDRDLYGAFVIARTPVGPGLVPVTPASLPDPPAFTAVRNLLYALEWWVFGLFAAFVWWRWCRDELAVAAAADVAATATAAGAGGDTGERRVPSAP